MGAEDEKGPSIQLLETAPLPSEDVPAPAPNPIPARDPGDGPAPGDNIGRFTLRSLIGQGGMGQVFAALDPTLGRTVALKIMHGRAARTRTRVMREGQALARLSHPNVVTIFEVGTHGDQVFLAMELVPGETLFSWLVKPHGWREVRDVLVAAGRGLAAAHGVGLVHRDFKPQNVIVDRGGAGRVVVLDFGLARAGNEPELDGESDDEGRAASSPLMLQVTGTGDIVGTLRYMAPEQHLGGAVTAASDQFAFCVVCYEALTGTRPFSGDHSAAILASMKRGAPPPAGVPSFLAAALMRGLAFEPADRFPSMNELLSVVSRDPARTAGRLGAAAFTAVALAAFGFVVARTGAPVSPCGSGAEPLAGVWDASRRASVIAHARGLDPMLGEPRAITTADTLDAYARSWSEMRLESCRATRVDGKQSDTLLDLRTRCLDHRLDEVRGTVQLLEDAGDRAALDAADVAATQLTPLDGCADAAALTAALPPPEEPGKRARVAALEKEVLAIELGRRSGRVSGLEVRARTAVTAARELDYPPVLAAALRVLADLLGDAGERTEELSVLDELSQAAALAHDDAGAVRAFTRLIGHGAMVSPERALALFPAASAAVLRGGNGARARVDLLVAEAQALTMTVKRQGEALAKLAEARQILEAEGAGKPGSPLLARLADVDLETARARWRAGNFDGSVASSREAIAFYRSAYGPDHPDEAYAWHNLGATLQDAGRAAEALPALAEAVRIRLARADRSNALALSLAGLGTALQDLGRYQDSLAPLEEAARIQLERLGHADPDRAATLSALGISHMNLGRLEEARREYDEAIEIARPGSALLGVAYVNRGDLAVKAGRCADALADYQKAVDAFDVSLGRTHFYSIFPLSAAGRCQVLLGHPAAALPLLERAAAIPAIGQGKLEQTVARFFHGRALVETRQRAGLDEARAARADLAALGKPAAAALAEADAWLGKHGR